MKTIRLILLTLTLLVSLAACTRSASPAAHPAETAQAVPAATALPEAQPSPAATGAIRADLLKNLAYHFQTVAETLPETNGDITLQDGQWKQTYPNAASGVLVQYLDSASGDLNGDGLPDAAVLLVINTGGSGQFIHLAAVTNEGGTPVHKATTVLGDRVKVETLAVQDGQIVLKLVTHGPQDPLCCPSQPAQAAYRLQGSELVAAP